MATNVTLKSSLNTVKAKHVSVTAYLSTNTNDNYNKLYDKRSNQNIPTKTHVLLSQHIDLW